MIYTATITNLVDCSINQTIKRIDPLIGRF